MSISGTFIRIMERGWLPDSVIGFGIRHLLNRRLEACHAHDGERWQDNVDEFIDSMRTGDVAFAQDKANEQHYELPVEFFETVLGPRLKYSCCLYEPGIQNLAQAEEAMLELTCRRAKIENGQTILDFGCGWGAFSLYVAEHFPKCRIRAVSNSHVQGDWIRQRCAERGLHNVTATTADAAEFDPGERFDRIVSVEMFEHMRNYEILFRRVASWLNPGGRFFLHIFTHRCAAYPFDIQGDSNWMAQYFFTGGMMPSHSLPLYFQDDLRIEEHWAVDGRHYERTLRDWLAIMDRRKSEVMPILKNTYGEEQADVWFQRWRVFFLACAELFGFHNGQEWWVSHYRFAPRPSANPSDVSAPSAPRRAS